MGDLIGEIPQAAVYIPKASILRQNCKDQVYFLVEH
jgi:hypothetical protein